MNVRRNINVEVVTDELRKAGITFRIEINKHAKIRFELAGRNSMYVVPVSGSDRRGPMAARSGIRRILRQAAA